MDMVIEVQVRIINPEQPAQVERGRGQLLADGGNLQQPLGRHGADAVVRVAGRHRGGIEEQQSADMQMHGRRLAVEASHPVPRAAPCAQSAPSGLGVGDGAGRPTRRSSWPLSTEDPSSPPARPNCWSQFRDGGLHRPGHPPTSAERFIVSAPPARAPRRSCASSRSERGRARRGGWRSRCPASGG